MKDTFPAFDLSDTSTKGQASKKILIFVGLFILIVTLGTVVVLATRIWDPLWNPFRPTPDKVTERSIKAMERVNTFQEKGEFSFLVNFPPLIKGDKGMKFELKLREEGKTDKTQPENPKSEFKFNLFLSLGSQEELGIGLGLAGEVLWTSEEEGYFRLTKIPGSSFLEFLGFSQLKNQWIKVDEKSLLELEKKSSDKEWTPEVEKKYKEYMEKEKRLIKDIEAKIKQKLSAKKLLRVKKELPDETINGIKVYHYVISLNNEEILNLFLEIGNEAMRELIPKGKEIFGEPVKEGELKTEIEELKNLLEKIGDIEGEVWIGKKDYYVYQFKLGKSVNVSELIKETPKEPELFEKAGRISFNIALEYFNFNQPVQINPPTEYKRLEEIFDVFIGEFEPPEEFKKPTSSLPDSEIKGNMFAIQIIAELLYKQDKNSYKNLCYKNTLNEKHPKYGKELANIEESIRKNQKGILNLSCYSSVNSYCVIADLISPEKGKYCIDSSGTGKEINQASSCIGKGTQTDPYQCPQEKLPSKKLPFKEGFFRASLLEIFLNLIRR